ncbi:transketolase [Candidatus Uhrbacteria bacterium RIFOXYB12_FULL_58_10]|uniref:Transketolase n=1 Tax=Candidatus Uhrbacteria bacterium RIFOXYB2_FULL_57_15 TaxID=1802422 RepID=A0A1F7W652_9BACT|nr:MAG: transketolase [Candidatus Uhrbacteria bacterium RIFOXYB12_FULL_58_10]OGL98096.1 MAG: transketolase [Candidatus Uhrbacteria bacterium RIFOXYB2_FULL_57_15]OGM00081.1 MAG: transketolase [Candidatus Uhrbacteria bacterium RIFOXYC12_FULL_57_11]
MAKKLPSSGINRAAYLVRGLFDEKTIDRKPTRDGYGLGLVDAGRASKNVVVLSADLTESTRALWFKEKYPERFVQLGVSEQSLAAIAAGMAMAGKIPFISSYAAFSPGRNWEQIRTTVALQNTNVKIAGAHAGVSVGPDGATHQMTEDIAIMRVIPNMRVIVPCDALEAKKATIAAAKLVGPTYLRFAREASPVFTTAKTPFKIGRAEIFRFGVDVTIVAAGPLLYEALIAAEALSRRGVETCVINMHTVKPLDVKALVQAAKQTGAIVTLEEAQVAGGLGGAVCEALAAYAPVPVERVGIQDRFGESGEPTLLLDGFGLTAPSIVESVGRALKRKRGEKVSDRPEYVAAAEGHLDELKGKIIAESLIRTPRKWGGKKPDASLKSRKRK